MKPSRSKRLAISLTIIGTSVFAWVLLLVNPGHILGIVHCHISDSGPSAASFQMLLAMNPFSSQLAGWGLMVVAMMLPKLILPIQDIYGQVFKHQRLISVLLFVLGYIGVWIVAGVFIITATLVINVILPKSYIPIAVIGIITLVWQFSPIKQRCLNRGHVHKRLSAFGWKAYADVLVFGVVHGLWCVGSGWALMWFPMILPAGHNFAMVIVTFIMMSEHLEHPRFPGWHIYFSSKLARTIFTRTQIIIKRTLQFN
ncbi:MAG: DUF2182 domain-containing protein [Bacteroidetes bacterium]|jgi:predicted metal-binding membrane protein|nr:DUF2182 domain-containing protein [Bacteroidota bacterium]